MGWVETLKGSIVGIDTSPFIYYSEVHSNYFQIVDPFFQALFRGDFIAVTSIVTLLESLVRPVKEGNTALAQEYRDILFDTEGIDTITLTQGIAEEAARLRAIYRIATPDAIQIATAIRSDATFCLTNDRRLSSISELKVLTLDVLKTL